MDAQQPPKECVLSKSDEGSSRGSKINMFEILSTSVLTDCLFLIKYRLPIYIYIKKKSIPTDCVETSQSDNIGDLTSTGNQNVKENFPQEENEGKHEGKV
jgi:hypothetical protein